MPDEKLTDHKWYLDTKYTVNFTYKIFKCYSCNFIKKEIYIDKKLDETLYLLDGSLENYLSCIEIILKNIIE